jgi:LCP family protein required for cell wall assembly
LRATTTATGEPVDEDAGLLDSIKRSAREALLKLVPDWQDAGRINVLLLGIDKQDIREGNTDVMMLASIDPGTRSALLLSIPRDLCLNECESYLDRLNGVYERDGPDALKDRVSEILGLPVDFHAAVNFNGFAEAIDLLGGIEVWVERDFDELFEFLETREQLRLRLDRGWHELTGREALSLARSRKFDPGGDFARICRQQQIVRQIREKALSIQIVPRIPELLIGLGDWFETDFPTLSMPSFAELAATIPSSRLHSRAITTENGMLEAVVGGDGARLLRPDLELIQDFVDEALLQSISDKQGGVAGHCPAPPPR